MRKITALTAQKKNQDRVNVFLDEQFAFGLALEHAMHLRVGDTLTEEQIAALQKEDEFIKARDKALRYLTYRPRSCAEVERNLRQKGYEDALVERVIHYLQERDFLDDRAFAHYWVEQRETFKPRSRIALSQELRKKGVNRADIDAALESVDEKEAAEKAAEKRAHRYAHLPYEEFKQKLGGYLQRRGFNYSIVRETTEKIWNNWHNNELP